LEQNRPASFLANLAISPFIDPRHAITHSEIIIIDQSTVITESFNFIRAAEENNAENLLIIKSMELAGIYVGNWIRHKQHSEVYKPGY
jgi:phosphatidylserine/phosphatidylglycerophosphate/cardiolipin synthase-like enzyme